MTPQPMLKSNTVSLTPARQFTGGAGGAGLGALVCWAWNTFMPEHQMPAEIGAIIGGLLTPFVNQYITGIKA